MKTDIKTFSKLFILEDGRPIQLEDWQLKYIIDPLFYTLKSDGTRLFNEALIGLPKKNGKSTVAALIAAYMLLADGEDYSEVYSIAGSRDQARIIFRQTSNAIKRSPILYNEVNVYRNTIERKDGRGFYQVLAADGDLQHGLNPHCLLGDELHVQTDYRLLEAMTHSPARKQPLHVHISYASYRPWPGDPCFDYHARGMSGEDPNFHFFWTHENLASWVTQEYLDQQRLRLPPHIYERLHENRFTTGSGSFLSREDVKAAVDAQLAQKYKGDEITPWIQYHASLDLGLKRDRTCLCLVHRCPDTRHIILDHLRLFEAPRGGEVQIEEVEDCIIQLAKDFNLATISFDPWQSIRSKQRLENKGLNITEFTFSGANIAKLTSNLFTLFKDKRIKIFEHKELIKELLSVKIVERSYGYRIDHESGMHDDTVIALGMACLPAALEHISDGSGEVDVALPEHLRQYGVSDWQTAEELGLKPGGDW